MTRRPPLRTTDPGIVAVAFPLRGEWRAANTPAHRVPSHGLDLWAQTYAYDLWRTDADDPSAFHRHSSLRYWTRGVHLADCPGYGEPVHAAFDGSVVRAADDLADRDHLQPVLDLLRVVRNGVTFRRDAEPWAMTGNHIVLAHDHIPDCFALYAHLAHRSLCVGPGDHVTTGTVLGAVGHTGNSTAPHLHFQLMTTADPRTAAGIRCAFDTLERHGHDVWTTAHRVIPGRNERIRSVTGSDDRHLAGRADGST